MTVPDNWTLQFEDTTQGMYLFQHPQTGVYVSTLPNHKTSNGVTSNTHTLETVIPSEHPNTQIIFKSFTETANTSAIVSYIQDELFPENPPRNNTVTTFANCNLDAFPESVYTAEPMSTEELWDIVTTLNEAAWVMKHREEYNILPCSVFYDNENQNYSFEYRTSHPVMRLIDKSLSIDTRKSDGHIATFYFEFPDGNVLRPRIRDIELHSDTVSRNLYGWWKIGRSRIPIMALRPRLIRPPSLEEYRVTTADGTQETVFAKNSAHASRICEVATGGEWNVEELNR